ncbi:SbtR family transcriptional regulator [Microbacterium forte]
MHDARAAAEDSDTESALATFLGEALALQLQDGGLQAVLLSPDDAEQSVRDMKIEIFAAFDGVLQRARDEKIIRPDLSIVQIEHLVCGIEHAVRIGEAGDRQLFLDIMLAGIRPTV